MEGGVEGDRKVSCSGCDRLEDSLDRLKKEHNGEMAEEGEEMEMSQEFDH
jgi:hypothetical protein